MVTSAWCTGACVFVLEVNPALHFYFQRAIRIFSHFINNKMTFPNKKWEQRSSVTSSLHHRWLIAYLSTAPSHSLSPSFNLYFSLCFHISLSFNTLVYFILSFSASSKQTMSAKSGSMELFYRFYLTCISPETQLFEFKSQFLFSGSFKASGSVQGFRPLRKPTVNSLLWNRSKCYLCGQSLV